MKYEVYVMKAATYTIEADSEEEALDVADEYLMACDFDDYEVTEIKE